MGVYPKMDGENNGNAYEQMDDLGGVKTVKTPIFGSTPIWPPTPGCWLVTTRMT